MKYAVVQYGARAHYAVPRILENLSSLERLFTDICAVKGWPALLRTIPQVLQPGPVRRLRSRIPFGVPRARITAFTCFGLRTNMRWARARTAEESTACYLKMGRELSQLVIKHGLGGAAGLYAFNGECLELLNHARQNGIRTVLEQTIAPKEIEVQLLTQEHQRHPDWGIPPESNALLPAFISRQHAEWAEADLIICGSQFVAEGITRCAKQPTNVEVIPYGVDSTYVLGRKKRHNGPLRVLTIGAIGVRKGSPYIYEAARALSGRASFRLIGSPDAPPRALQRLSECAEVLGRIPRSEVIKHYAWADVFLLPSLCEGSAMVVYEALSAGLPVITTPNTGTVVRDGLDGFVVPIQDSAAIIEALERLAAGGHDYIGSLSGNARDRAKEFNLASYARRLASVLLN